MIAKIQQLLSRVNFDFCFVWTCKWNENFHIRTSDRRSSPSLTVTSEFKDSSNCVIFSLPKHLTTRVEVCKLWVKLEPTSMTSWEKCVQNRKLLRPRTNLANRFKVSTHPLLPTGTMWWNECETKFILKTRIIFFLICIPKIQKWI